MAVIFGVLLTLIGIGCAVEARLLFIGQRRFDENGMGVMAFLFSVGAFLTLALATVLFVKAYRGRKGKK